MKNDKKKLDKKKRKKQWKQLEENCNFPKNEKLQFSSSFFHRFFFFSFFNHLFYHLFIMFHHFCFQWCKNVPKNGKVQFSSSFFIFLRIVYHCFILFFHFCFQWWNWWKMKKMINKNNEKLKKQFEENCNFPKNEKLQFPHFFIFSCVFHFFIF